MRLPPGSPDRERLRLAEPADTSRKGRPDFDFSQGVDMILVPISAASLERSQKMNEVGSEPPPPPVRTSPVQGRADQTEVAVLA